jgi:thiamine-monophosphate kinase
MKKFSELEFIRNIRKKVVAGNDNLITGIGDDTAIIRCEGEKDLLITCDLMTEGVHFSLDYFTPADIGWRSLAANLSDIASMGGKPLYYTLSIAVPPHLKKGSFLDELLEGMQDCAKRYGVLLIGGDTSSSKDALFIDIAMVGEVEKGKAFRRCGASPGDLIFILGIPGRAEAGLQLFLAGWRFQDTDVLMPEGKKFKNEKTEIISQIMLAHLRPSPCLDAGKILSKYGIPSAMIDTSDGVSTDLFHICEESGVGAELDYAAFDQNELNAVKQILPDLDVYNCIINGGEDYSLLFTASEKNHTIIESLTKDVLLPSPRLIGRITDNKGRMMISIPGKKKAMLKASGWEHK